MNTHGHQAARQHLPRLMREFGESDGTLACYLGAVAIVAFIISRNNPRIWNLLLPSALGPIATAVYLWISPLNPYRMSGKSVDHDPIAQKLIALLRSSEARRYCFKIALVMSPLLTGFTLLMARLQKPIDVSFDPSQDFQWILMQTFLIGGMTLGVDMCLLLRWAFPRWEQSENRSN